MYYQFRESDQMSLTCKNVFEMNLTFMLAEISDVS